MIVHAWTVVADKVIIDRDSNNVSVDALEQLNVPGPLPAPLEGEQATVLAYRLHIVSLWYRVPMEQPAAGNARIRLLAPEAGQELAAFGVNVNLNDHHRARTRLAIVGIPLTGPGTYFFSVELESDGGFHEVARVPLEIVVAGAMAPAPPAPG
jgi:hypothetical protein